MVNDLKQCAFRIDPVLWVQMVLSDDPKGWQRQFLRAPRGASILALTARQIGKTTAACWAMAHTAIYRPGSLSVVACPAQRQSAEAIRRVRDSVLTAGATLIVENVYGLELENGARVLALPGTDDSVRGLTVDGWIVADEAARLSDDLIAALRPMRARKPDARFAMLSTAWSRTDPFWQAWDGEDNRYIRLNATVGMPGVDLDPDFLEGERLGLGEERYKREYLGIPVGGGASPFSWELYEQATRHRAPLAPAGPDFAPAPEAEGRPAPNPFQQLRHAGVIR
jgi:Terminase large subunit, T4likevirus-type, N-terminal